MNGNYKIKITIGLMIGTGIIAIVLAFIFRLHIDRTTITPPPASYLPEHKVSSVSPLSISSILESKADSQKTHETTSGQPQAVVPAMTPQPPAVTSIRIEPELEDSVISGSDQTVDEKVKVIVEWFKKSDLLERPRQLSFRFQELAQKGDEISTHVLMAFAQEENSMVSSAAIAALGTATNSSIKDDVVKVLRNKLKQTKDITIECTVLESMARIGGDAVTDELRNYILTSWRRSDGCGEKVATAIVKGMADVGTYKAGEFLVLELMRADTPDWSYDYGTAVVEALRKYKHPLVKQALMDYIEKVRRRMEKEIGIPHQYLKEKQEEVKKAIVEQDTQP